MRKLVDLTAYTGDRLSALKIASVGWQFRQLGERELHRVRLEGQVSVEGELALEKRGAGVGEA